MRRIDFISPVAHFWSLALEEQFYLVWPLLVLLAPTTWLKGIVLLTIAVAPALRVAGEWVGGTHVLSVLPPGSGDSLGIGAWISLYRNGVITTAWSRRTLTTVALTIVLPLWAVCLLAGQATNEGHPAARVFGQLLQAIVFGVLVLSAADAAPEVRWLRNRWTVALGKISYSIYLVHVFTPTALSYVLASVGRSRLEFSAWVVMPVILVLTILTAAGLWRWVEMPFNRLKSRWPYGEAGGPQSASGFQRI